jgi:D-3-phosphoglycerate dehydrogenase / 2-oxoglutarate reductase
MKQPVKILVTDNVHERFIEAMQAAGCEVHYRNTIQKEEVLAIIADYEILLINSRIKADKTLIDKGIKLKAIARIGSGLEVIDTEYASTKNIACINAPEGNKDAVAEHALGMLLCLLNNIHIANAEVKAGQWLREKNRGTELGGKTIGIIGFGNNGSAFAEKLKGFNVTILAYDKYKTNFGNEYVKESTLQEIFEAADIVSLHLPLTEETYQFVNKKFISALKKNFYFLNMARGKNVNTEDLISALHTGKILGACLDVLENENLETLTSEQQQHFQQLAAMNNVLLTPHIAGWTYQSKIKIAEALATKLEKSLSDF